jgi:hypothetical protein
MSKCEFKCCRSDLEGAVRVNENLGDACFSTRICIECADCIGIREGQDIPDDAGAVNRKLSKHYSAKVV